MSGGGTFCAGVTPTAVTVSLIGSPLWQVSYTLNGIPQTINSSTSTISLGNSAGTYILTSVTDALCTNSASGTVSIVINTAPIINLTVTSPSTCNGTNGSIEVIGSGSGNLSWTGTTSGSATAVTLPYVINSLSAGTYSVIFTNASTGCSSLATDASLNNPGAPVGLLSTSVQFIMRQQL
jgi:hypothetical protein